MKIKAALIVDNCSITVWQRKALENAFDYLDIKLVLNCKNTQTKKNILKNFAYYILNIFSMRNNYTKKTNLNFDGFKIINFNSIYNGAWQSMPENVSQEIEKNDIKLVIKFGMSLLKIDKGIADLDILSFHHGDPVHFRGRPAGFYEVYEKANRVGLIVQKISNQLDAGEILVRAYAKIHHHSYKKTVESFYEKSEYLLRKALINYKNGERVKIENFGPNYRLPDNITVCKFLFKLLNRKITRIIYGLFFEKKWNIVKMDLNKLDWSSGFSMKMGLIPEVEDNYTFYADPFFSIDGKNIRAEALNKKSGLGEIIEIDANSLEKKFTLLKGGHYSYPYSFEDSGIEYVMPEVASHSDPYLLEINNNKIIKKNIEGLNNFKLVDGSLIKHNNIYYIFGGNSKSAADCLWLFMSNNITGPYLAHPNNPIVIDPSSARMAGRLYFINGKIYRFGQNNCYGYGDEIVVNEIIKLSPSDYLEKKVGKLNFLDARGPHTIDINGSSAVLDFYTNKFSIFAGYRRIAAIFS